MGTKILSYKQFLKSGKLFAVCKVKRVPQARSSSELVCWYRYASTTHPGTTEAANSSRGTAYSNDIVFSRCDLLTVENFFSESQLFQ